MYYRNIIDRKLYKVIDTLVTNTTNDYINERMVLYKNKRGNKFVMCYDTFNIKFEKTDKAKFE